MREILFRAAAINRDKGSFKTKYKNGDWVYGLITRLYDERFENLPAEMTNTDGISGIDVDYRTIGQYTDLTDKNGKKIFEGDIICIPFTEDTEYSEYTYYEYGTVYFDEKYLAWCVKFNDDETMFLEEYDDCCATVTGNIHDNPELLKGDNND